MCTASFARLKIQREIECDLLHETGGHAQSSGAAVVGSASIVLQNSGSCRRCAIVTPSWYLINKAVVPGNQAVPPS